MGKIKGQFLVLGFTILGLALIGLAVLIATLSKESTSQVIIFGSLERLNNLDSSIKKSLVDIFQVNSGINISGNDTSVVFTENIPNNMANYNSSMYNFKIFTEQNYKNIELNITNLSAELKLIIHPHLIGYFHDFNNKKIKILPQALNVEGYFLNFSIPTTDQLICNGSIISGNLYFSIEATTNNNRCNQLFKIDPTLVNDFSITSNIIIRVENPAFVTITNSNANTITLTSMIILNMTDSKGFIKVRYPENIYRIDFLKELDLYKKDTATLYTRLINSGISLGVCEDEEECDDD